MQKIRFFRLPAALACGLLILLCLGLSQPSHSRNTAQPHTTCLSAHPSQCQDPPAGISSAVAAIRSAASGQEAPSLLSGVRASQGQAAPSSWVFPTALAGGALLVLWAASLFALIWQIARHRKDRARLLRQIQLTQQSYLQLKTQHEEVLMLRHDMAAHLRILREKAGTSCPEVTAYLNELTRQAEAIRPVIQSGSHTLDFLLNGFLQDAARVGVQLKIVRASATEPLPLSEVDLSSLVSNILDNALRAAAQTQEAAVSLDIHCKSGFFVLICENSALPKTEGTVWEDRPVPAHGLGLKIIRKIVRRGAGILNVAQTDSSFRLSLAIPLAQAQ